MPTNVKVTKDRTPQVIAALRELARTRIMVGVPEEEDPRQDDGTAGNALLSYIHNNGSPARNIPARPHLIPGIERVQSQTINGLKNAGKAALDGNQAQAEQIMTAIGQLNVDSVKDLIRSNIPPPLKPATIRNRRRRSKGSKYRRRATTASDVTALIDTAQLLRAYTSVLRKI